MGMGSFGAFRMSSKPLFSDDRSITSSTSITETVTGGHEFTIRGYSLSKGIGVGNPLVSDTFIVGGHAWAIHFFPDGKSEEDNSAFVSVFISLLSAGSDVRALFELTLLDQTGKGNHKVHTHFEQPRENGPYTLHGYGSMWGYKRFFKRSLLETSDYLKDDRLLIHCRIGVVKCNTVGPKTYSITVPPSTIGQHFGQLLESGEGTDVNFEIDGEIVPAHKLVLAARSPVFKAQFFGPLKEKNSACIKVDDMEAPVFKALLHFMYWDELPDVETFTGLSTKWASTLIAQHLLAAADLYGLERLKLLCEAKLCEDVAINTVANTLVLAEQHGCVQLKALCLKFVSMPENLRAVTQTDGFNYLKDSCPALLGEILENVANAEEHPLVITTRHEGFRIPDGGDIFGRRLKRRMP